MQGHVPQQSYGGYPRQADYQGLYPTQDVKQGYVSYQDPATLMEGHNAQYGGGTAEGTYSNQYTQLQHQMNNYNYNANQTPWQQQYAPQQGIHNPANTNDTNMFAPPTAVGAAAAPHVGGAVAPTGSGASATTASHVPPPPPAAECTDENGLRWTWSTYPNHTRDGKQEAPSAAALTLPEMVIPLACMYTPLFPIDASRMVIGDPTACGQQCQNCGAFWSHHCYREEGKFWVCFSCQRRNQLPPHYRPEHPALHNDTVEYILPLEQPTTAQATRGVGFSPTFVFIIDTCIAVEELEALKCNIQRCLNWLPPQSLIGLVSFGARVSVWDLSGSSLSRCYSIRGDRAYTTAELGNMLQLNDGLPARGRFLVPLEECEFTLTTSIEGLQCHDGVTPVNKRPLRATGTAVSAAVRLLEALPEVPVKKEMSGAAPAGVAPVRKAGRVLLFTGGPCTRGPGTVVSIEKESMMRFHRDIIEGETPYYEAAFKFYNEIQLRLLDVNASLSVFAESFDQIGILEMRQAVDQTGGTFICGDTFDHQMFTISLQRYFDLCDLRPPGVESSGISSAGDIDGSAPGALVANSGFGVKLHVHTSDDTLVSGVLGPCVAAEKTSGTKAHRASISPIEIGVGGTTDWRVSTIDQGTTYTVVFDTATLNKVDGMPQQQQNRFIQFVTHFTTPLGESRIRVTSVALPIAPVTITADGVSTANPQYFSEYDTFDQTCAATVLARMTVSILEKHPSKWNDAKRWLDTVLVRFVRRYGSFTPGSPESLRLRPCFTLFPSFVFNLRRSEYFMVLNISPDESTFKRHWLMRESVDNCVLMIQPTLHSYDMETPTATAVPLDSCSLRPDNILLMDAFFNIHIMWGTVIFAWIQARYQDNPEYAHFAQLLETVENEATMLLDMRYPYPRFSRTDANGSEARHIKTRMNPTTTHHSGARGGNGVADLSDVIYTDDASIVKFMESLKQAVVTPESKK
ncbi:protein transport protein sec23, putative [Trypanosoma brucei gambiense DAL972]|uniref:Protein transport protein SEC23 n=1 Tax=Trypanosoma brucei gambiense (strain MHOM/CI/86/DAL972) TaxID=679716 RepID=C9ZVF2_TRYB9|nr:protein transport protein sec23, putative [Trypanosoma brucei gambiense DAL972]CBH13390.1 protein transport protein sec23, putative [Trypanosoma brucei gambiense DAL972]|eukprot:XP_011775667.1 protein transport protein sec23, putative [Trypanosoma brucei gambiense DAL972]